MSYYDEWVLSSDQAVPSLPFASDALASVAARQGVVDEESFRRFVEPSLGDLHDPEAIHGMGSACERIEKAIRDREQILIYGDYDVDGVTSIVLLRTVLRALGARVEFVVPHRLIDGYGLRMEVLDRVLSDRSVGLVITVDCGITSIEPVRQAIDRGIDIIITDHHLPPELLPSAVAVLNPKQEGCSYPFEDLAGVGVAFKLCCALLKRRAHPMSVASLAKIAAIGTVADVAPLVEENRTIARLGLQGLSDTRNPGLRTLLEFLGLSGSKVRADDVGFRIGPRINAAGRMASADTAVELFWSRNKAEALPLVFELERMNVRRRAIQKEVCEAAEAQIHDPQAPLLIAAGPGWHRGVLGLCASHLMQKFHRPALAITVDDDECAGSGRSIPGVDLHGLLDQVRGFFTHFGGHHHACGFALRRDDLEPLKKAISETASRIGTSCFRRSAIVDGELSLRELDAEWFREHEMLEPFGAGNPRPRFLLRGVRGIDSRQFAEQCRSIRLSDGALQRDAILWPARARLAPQVESGSTLDLLVFVEPDRFREEGYRLSIDDGSSAGTLV